MHIKELEKTVHDKLKWKSISEIPNFPLGNFDEVKEKIHTNKFSTGIDYTTANKLAEWLYGTKYAYFWLFLTWTQFMVPILAVILAIVFRNYWLLLGVVISPFAFFISNPYNPSRKYFSSVAFLLFLIFLYALWQGDQMTTYLTAFFIMPFAINRYVYSLNQRKLQKVALESEEIFIYLYQTKALGVRNNETGEMHFYIGEEKYEAIGIVIAGNGKVESKITLNSTDKKPLLAMALCYAAKVKWLILTEPTFAERTFTNVFNNTLNEWPNIPYVEMLSSIRNETSIYQVTVYYNSRKGWYINNTIPLKGYYSGDIVTNYFILLRAIISELNDKEKALLGNLLNKFKENLLGISAKDKSYNGLEKILKKANELLQNL